MTPEVAYVLANLSKQAADALKEARRVRSAHAAFAPWGPGERADMMVELANLREKRCPQFRKQYQYGYRLPDSDEQLLKRREELRNVWSANWMGDSEAALVLRRWVDQAARRKISSWILVPFARMRYGVIPNYRVLPLSLAIGATELASKMAICANPNCRNPFFLKRRKTQRFCDLRACKAYGQREHKRNWWNSHRATAREFPPYSAPPRAAQDSGRLKRTPEEKIKSPANDAETSRTG